MQKTTADLIIATLKDYVERKIPVAREAWLESAMKLSILRLDEAQLLNRMKQEIAQKKLNIYKKQEKRNVAACDLEIEASEEYKFAKDQEEKIYTMDEMVRVAKKLSDINL